MQRSALGIPDINNFPAPRKSAGELWEFAIHHHRADRAGPHFDLRLGDPKTGHGHSWAVRKLPEPGQKTLAVQQPVHTIDYFDFSGRIPEGYGKGDVELQDRGKAEVLRSTPNIITFNRYKGKGTEEYVLVKTNDTNWILINRTPTQSSHPHISQYKPPYKKTTVSDLHLDAPGVMQPKIDAAHVLVDLMPGSRPRVFSYRPSEISDRLIQHTYRINDLVGVRVPKDISHTIFRGELYLKNKAGVALPPEQQAAILNMGVEKARDYVKNNNLKFSTYLFDVVQHGGKRMEDVPYSQRLSIIKSIAPKIPSLEVPEYASSLSEKKKLLDRITSNKHPLTREGVIVWPETGKPVKVKMTDDNAVYIRSIFPGGGKYTGHSAGGFSYSLTPKGPIVGRVGTGFSDAERKDMTDSPGNWVGKKAVIEALQKFKSGAFRAPAFKYLHDIGAI